MPYIKAITLYQPWASLVVLGQKRIETRGWSTRYRGMLAIHASKAFPKWVADLCSNYPFTYYLGRFGISGASELPRGAVLGVADLVSDVLFGDWTSRHDLPVGGWNWIAPNGRFYDFQLTQQEVALGDFSKGRHGFLLADAMKFEEPILGVRGQLGLWNFDRSLLPPEAIAGYWQGLAM